MIPKKKTKIDVKKIYNKQQIIGLALIRILIGWHFLYEGLVKLHHPNWTAKLFLKSSVGPFSDVFRKIAGNQELLSFTDFLNIWGLILIGLSFMLGLFSKPAKIAALLLLSFYYLAYPPFIGLEAAMSGAEGNYLVVNKILIEMAAIVILLLFPSSTLTGLDRYIFTGKNENLN